MKSLTCNKRIRALSRRELLETMGAGFGGLALSALLAEQDAVASSGNRVESATPLPLVSPRVKRVIMLFMFGGPSHIDSFDPKPRLTRDDGKPLPFDPPRVLSFPLRHGNMVRSPFQFQQHGQSGAWVSELFPELARHVDKLCIINSVHCSNSRHGGAVLEWHTGSDTFIRPSMGSWLTYGLGTENQNLPGYLTICQSLSQGGANNFGSSFLPAVFQGTPIGNNGIPTKDAKIPFIESRISSRQQRVELDMLRRLTEHHLVQTGPDSDLESRIENFELAFRMQTAVPDIQELSDETETTFQLYGIDDPATEDFGRQCLMARRFSEKGVRFVQCNSNGWDHHSDLKKNMENMCQSVDRPISGLLQDLQQRGLLEETLVIWGGEFGRTPTAENANGRDHNPHGFTMWLAGGGVQPGLVYGKTDDYGYYAMEDKVHFHDLHATILHMMGLDHEKLVYRYSGRDFRLTDVYGRVVHEILV